MRMKHPGQATRHWTRPASQRPGNSAIQQPWHRTLGPDSTTNDHVPFQRSHYLAVLEALLFLAEEPIPGKKLQEWLHIKNNSEWETLLHEMQIFYSQSGSPFGLHEIAGGYQLLTDAEYYPWLLRLRRSGQDTRLSTIALETLAIIADKQPIMRAEIDAIRGVASVDVIRNLIEKGFVKISGRHDSLGRPQLYSTTRKFLEVFGYNSIADLQSRRDQAA